MRLKNKHIFILGSTRFDGDEQSTGFHIARQFSRENFVYYIDYPTTFKDYFKFKIVAKLKNKRPRFSSFSYKVLPSDLDNLKIVICPPVFSINFIPEGFLYRTLLKVNEIVIRNSIKRVIKSANIKQYVYINSFNFHYPGIADKLNPSLKVYQCVDPMVIPYDMKHGIESENILVSNSDLVICTSKKLFEEKRKINPKTFFVPNAADIAKISGALDDALPVNTLIVNLKRPIIGYAGSIERRLDFDLLKEITSGNRDKTFVFAGQLSMEFVPEWFLRAPNIVLTGRLPHNDIPGLLKGFDIAIIPFKKDIFSQTIFPLKLFEYLGSGKPVVATDFNPDLEQFTDGVVSFCKTADSFSAAIEEILQNDNAARQQSRINIAKENTWEKRGNEISELIAANLPQEDRHF